MPRKHKLGSKKNPLPIRQMCVRGHSSSESKEVLRGILSGDGVTSDKFRMDVDGRPVWIELKSGAFRAFGHELKNSITSKELMDPGVLMTPLTEHHMRRFDVPEKSPTLYRLFKVRRENNRVLELTEAHLNLLMKTGRRPKQPPQKIREDLRKQISEHIKKELELHKKS